MQALFVAILLSVFFACQAFAAGCASCSANSYHCPSEDNTYGRGEGPHYLLTSSSCCGTALTCYYSAGQATYNCVYNESGGALTTDNDSGYCPANALSGALRRGVSAARSSLSSRITARTPERERQVRETMEGMGVRRELGKGKASAREVKGQA